MLENYHMPFRGRIDPCNRWVKMAKLMPWDMIEEAYARSFNAERTDGRPPIPSRIAFGAIYIKEYENLTDTRTVEHIAENVCMQYFLGLEEYTDKPLFDPSMMTHFRKRFSAEAIKEINEELYRRTHPKAEPPDAGESGGNKGTLVLDATAAPSDIRYPTDLSLLNECRENQEKMIDELWEYTEKKGHKTGYSRKKARKKFLAVAKQRKPRRKELHKAVGEQLIYVGKNLVTIALLLAVIGLTKLPERRGKRLEVIRAIYEQQKSMYDEGKNQCENRIVSLRQPHVRAIYRGKAGGRYEFGQKLAFSVTEGFVRIEKQQWDNFNEGITLIESAERYRKRFGVYPEVIQADQIYRNADNRKFCKQNNIRLSGPKLGRPKASEIEEDRELAYRDSCERNIVESRNGISKRRFGLDLIMAYLPCTAETEAALQVFAMNVNHCLGRLLRLIFGSLFWHGFSRVVPGCSIA